MVTVTQNRRGLPKKMERVTQKRDEGYRKLVQYCVTRGSTFWNVLSGNKNVRIWLGPIDPRGAWHIFLKIYPLFKLWAQFFFAASGGNDSQI